MGAGDVQRPGRIVLGVGEAAIFFGLRGLDGAGGNTAFGDAAVDPVFVDHVVAVQVGGAEDQFRAADDRLAFFASATFSATPSLAFGSPGR